MLINPQKKSYLPTLQSSKSSSINLSRTGTSNQDSIVKKIALAVINLLLIPFKLAQSAYYKLFKVEIKPKTGLFNNFFNAKTSIKELITKNKSTTALIGTVVTSLLALGYKASQRSSQKERLANTFASYIGSNKKLLVLTALATFALYKLVQKSSLGKLKKARRSKRANLKQLDLDKIKGSPECYETFKQILDDKNLANKKKSDLIITQIQAELGNFAVTEVDAENTDSIISFVNGDRKILIANAQIHFSDVLFDFLRKFHYAEGLNLLKEEIDGIKNNNAMNSVEKANAINNVFSEYLKCIHIGKLCLQEKNLKAILPCIEELPELTELYLYNNLLTFLPESITKLTQLEILYLDNNRLASLGPIMQLAKNSTQIKKVLLGENPLPLPHRLGRLSFYKDGVYR